MARRYKRRRKNANNETLLLLVVVGFLAAGAFSTDDSSLSSTAILLLILITLLLGLVVLAYAFYVNFKHQQALRQLGLAAVDTMSGTEFERWVGAQMRTQGYNVSLTPINDYGADIVARKDGVKTAVQVKRYSNVLDQKPIREAVAGMTHYKCSHSMVVTNSSFTKAAQVLARSNRCELIDRDKLAEWLIAR